MKQHLSIKKFYGYSEQAVHNQVYLAMIVYCLNVLAQLDTNSSRTYLQISRYLKASLWRTSYIWLRKIKGKGVTYSFLMSLAHAIIYSKKMDVYYLYFSILTFLFYIQIYSQNIHSVFTRR